MRSAASFERDRVARRRYPRRNRAAEHDDAIRRAARASHGGNAVPAAGSDTCRAATSRRRKQHEARHDQPAREPRVSCAQQNRPTSPIAINRFDGEAKNPRIFERRKTFACGADQAGHERDLRHARSAPWPRRSADKGRAVLTPFSTSLNTQLSYKLVLGALMGDEFEAMFCGMTTARRHRLR